MSGRSRERFAAAVRAEPVDLALCCLLVAAEIEPAVDEIGVLATLDALAASVRRHLPRRPTVGDGVEALRRALGEEAGFAGSAADYRTLSASSLPSVLAERHGLPILLTVVWVEVARRAGVAAYPIGVPGHFLCGVGDPAGDHVVVDPFRGGRTAAAETLAARRGAGPRAWQPLEVLFRLLTNVRAAAHAPDPVSNARTQLWAVELSLLLPRHPAVLRRERGELLARVGRWAEAAAELRAFADAVRGVDEALAQQVEASAGLVRSRLN